MNVIPLAVVYLLATLVLGGLSYTTSDGLGQTIYVGAASAFLAVFLGLVAVNLVLNSTDRKRAAEPLLRLIGNLAQRLHNEFFIQLGRDNFGSHKFNQLIKMYQENNGSPEVFAPDDLEKLYGMLMSKRTELADIYLRVEATARDMASILGWAYDPGILRAVLSTRTDILSFTGLMSLEVHDIRAKRKLVEHYLDVEGAMMAWIIGLAKKLGAEIEQSEDNPSL